MQENGNAVRIGQEVFVLHDGEVVRTMVAKLDGNGYQFLNGNSERCPHWFTFKDAAAAASNRLSSRQAALRIELRALALKRRALETQTYQDDVMSAPYKVVDLRDDEALSRGRRRQKRLKKILVPVTYLPPGSVAYAIITPMTRSEYQAYRPYKHFVLETEVRSVGFSPDGQVHYTFSTPFFVEQFHATRKEACARLDSFSEPGTKDPLYFVSSTEEKRALEKLDRENIPF